MNTTFKVASFYTCDNILNVTVNSDHPIWKQTQIGCQILLILQEMYGFNITYVPEYLTLNETKAVPVVKSWNTEADIFLRPMNLEASRWEIMYPVLAAYTWKYGFVLRLSASGFYRTFYSRPFTRPAWNCLYAMALIISIVFYLLKRWEFSVLGGWNCSYPYEILMVIGAYCQHIPPIEARLPSRRIAYFVFFIYAYVVYTYYTSNLLSHLVNDKKYTVTLNTLASSNLECVIVDYMQLTFSENVPTYNVYGRITTELGTLRPVSIDEGMEGVLAGKMALLSDYISLYPYAKYMTNDENCEISSIDLFSDIKKYLYTSKHFPFKEEFKIAALRMKETGILKQLKIKQEKPACTTASIVQTKFVQISFPVLILFCTYIISVLILLLERKHYKRNKVYPYVN